MGRSSITHFKKQPPEMFYKKVALKKLAIFTTRKNLWWSLFLINLQTLRPLALLKRQVFSCDYCKIFNIYFLRSSASGCFRLLKYFVEGIWLQLICFLTSIAFWPMKYLFRMLCVVFIVQIIHYGKFTALHSLFRLFRNRQMKSSKNFPRNHAVPGLFS